MLLYLISFCCYCCSVEWIWFPWQESAVEGKCPVSLLKVPFLSVFPWGSLSFPSASQNPAWCRRAFPSSPDVPKMHSHLFLRSLFYPRERWCLQRLGPRVWFEPPLPPPPAEYRVPSSFSALLLVLLSARPSPSGSGYLLPSWSSASTILLCEISPYSPPQTCASCSGPALSYYSWPHVHFWEFFCCCCLNVSKNVTLVHFLFFLPRCSVWLEEGRRGKIQKQISTMVL